MALGFGRLTGYLTTVLRVGSTNQNVPLAGTIKLTPQFTHAIVTGDDEPQIILPSPITVAVVAGHIEDDDHNQYVELTATNLPDTSPPEFVYKVEFALAYEGQRIRFGPYMITIPENETVDLAEVTPIPNVDNLFVPGMLNGLRANKGKSAYDLAVEHNGFVGTEEQFAATLAPRILIIGSTDPVPTDLDGVLVARLIS